MIEIRLGNKKKYNEMWRNFLNDINLCDTCKRKNVCDLKEEACFDKTYFCVEYERDK